MTDIDEIKRTIGLEGGLSNDPDDTGGLTKYGISQASYPDLDIPNLTLQGAIEIYRRDYYERLGCPRINDPAVRWKLFDIGVNLGTARAARMIQGIVGVNQDGIIGPETTLKINIANNLVQKLIKEQVKHYASIVISKPTQAKFLMGWINRAFET